VTTEEGEVSILLSCLTAVAALSVEPDQSWIALANGPDVSESCRRYILEQFFRHQVCPGTKISELARLLQNPTWLHDRQIETWFDGTEPCFFVGWLPVKITRGDTVFCLFGVAGSKKQHDSLYIRVKGTMPRKTFVEALRGRRLTSEEDTEILEIVCFPDFNF
jgi:hypothetical protein